MERRKILREQQIYCKKGRNSGKELGICFWKEGMPPYYFLQKTSSRDQLFKLKKYHNLLPVSSTVIEDLKKLKVDILIFYLCFPDDSFFIVVPRKDFEKGELLNFDDKQFCVKLNDYIRHYEFPRSLGEFVK